MKDEKIRMGMERTFNGWMRTGLLLLGIGAVAAEDLIDLEPEWAWWLVGLIFIVTGNIILIYNFWEFYINFRKQEQEQKEKQEQQEQQEEIHGMPVWLIALISALMIVGAFLVLLFAFI